MWAEGRAQGANLAGGHQLRPGQEPGGGVKSEHSFWGLGPSPPSPLAAARRLPGDPQWLSRYLGYVRQFRLQEAPVFNLQGKRCPDCTQATRRGYG